MTPNPQARVDGFICLRLKSLLVFALVTPGFMQMRAWAQSVPTSYIPAGPPLVEISLGASQAATGAGPIAMVSGWSLDSELAPTIAKIDHPVQLKPGASDLVIFFNLRSPSTGAIEYRYRLAKYDHHWTTTHDHLAHYHHLPPGDYRFEVQARTPGQAWTSPVASLSVVQRHFFYQSWYFYGLLFFGLVALAFKLSHRREQLLKGQIGIILEERKRIASDFHDTLMTGLAATSWQLEATAKHLASFNGRPLSAAQSCELAQKMVAHCQAEARRIIWDLRDSNELTGILSQALSRTLAANCSREDMYISFDVSGDEIPIAPAAMHHLVSIGQEAVNNAIRHSGATRIIIHLKYEEDSLQLSIRDNGRGFRFHESQISHGHFGILGMQERARKLGASLRVDSVPGAGTEVVLTAGFHAVHSVLDQQQRVLQWVGV